MASSFPHFPWSTYLPTSTFITLAKRGDELLNVCFLYAVFRGLAITIRPEWDGLELEAYYPIIESLWEIAKVPEWLKDQFFDTELHAPYIQNLANELKITIRMAVQIQFDGVHVYETHQYPEIPDAPNVFNRSLGKVKYNPDMVVKFEPVNNQSLATITVCCVGGGKGSGGHWVTIVESTVFSVPPCPHCTFINLPNATICEMCCRTMNLPPV